MLREDIFSGTQHGSGIPGTTPTARTMLWMVAWFDGFRAWKEATKGDSIKKDSLGRRDPSQRCKRIPENERITTTTTLPLMFVFKDRISIELHIIRLWPPFCNLVTCKQIICNLFRSANMQQLSWVFICIGLHLLKERWQILSHNYRQSWVEDLGGDWSVVPTPEPAVILQERRQGSDHTS